VLKIGDFSRLAQVTIKTLRFYDEIGLFKPAVVDRFTGYRYYTLDQLPRLNRIVALKDVGFSLEQIADMLNSDLTADEVRGMLRLKRTELQQQIEDSQARLTRLDMRLRQIEMEDNMSDYEIIIKKIEAQQAVCIRQIVPHISDIHRLFDRVQMAIRDQNIRPNGPWMALYHHAGYRDHDLDIEIAVPVESSPGGSITLDNGQMLTVRTVPAIERALTALWRGSYQELGEVYTALSTYLHDHDYHYLGPAREVYLRGPGDTANSADYLTEIQYPVGEFDPEMVVDGTEYPPGWKDTRSIRADYLPLTRRARTVLDLAKVEAAALQTEVINPVHVLLALLRESDGFAGHVLGGFGITVEQMRTLNPRGKSQSAAPLISDSARQVLTYADAEARQLGHNYIGTEHLVLGLVQHSDATVMHLLSSVGVNAEQVRAAVMQTLNRQG
jgi:DNA-binding transcriptional MerR regulator